ncbi:MAG TPA: CGNR zinc finger domain-containing protein [Streptosporangiaceae bacterium]
MSDSSAMPADHPHPAPGPLRLIQSFASTRGTAPDSDVLRTREEAAAWLHKAGLMPPEAGLTNSEHAALLRLRDSIREVLAAHTRGRRDAESAARLTKALADGRLVLTVDPAGAVQLASAARASYPHVVATFAVAVADSATSGTWSRLKACTGPRCGRAFYDDSPAADSRRCSTHIARR